MQPEFAVYKGRVDEALRLYQEALEIRPDSIEVKTNIELLMRQQQPSPSKSDNSSDSESNQSEDSSEGGRGQRESGK